MASKIEMQGAHVVLTGTKPLLCHNGQLASTFNEFSQRMAKISSLKKKTELDRRELAHIEFLGSLYFDPDAPELGPCLPVDMIQAAIGAGGVVVRQRTNVERAVTNPMTMQYVPLFYDGPRDPEEMWGNGLADIDKGTKQSPFVDFRSVKITGKKVDRCRPIFRDWSLELDLAVDLTVMDWDMFTRIIEIAGRTAGLGDFRRGGFGRFTAEVTKVDYETLIMDVAAA